MGIDLIKDMAEAVKATARQQERTSPYDTSAEVRRIEGGTAWVHIPGGVDETPVKLTIACKPGDTVQVRVGGGSAWLVGNASAPPTDDTRANEIYELLKKTRKGLKEVIKNEVDEMIDDGEVGKGILKVVIEHCLANARNIPIGGTFADIQFSAWQELLPAFVTGKFYWARIVTYYADGTVEYGPPYFDMGAQVTAEVNIAVQEAQDTADEAKLIAQHGKVVKIIIQHCLANARSLITGQTFADIQYSTWQEDIPNYIAGKYYWARMVIYYADGTVMYSDPYFDMDAQVTAEVNIAVQEAQDTADEAERIAREASQTAGQSRKVFNSTPTPPYAVNDLWFDSAHGLTYLCSTAKTEGETFAQSDWTIYSTDVSSHFWYDSSGAHIAENQGDVTTGASQTIASTGTVMMRNGKVITSWTGTGSGDAAINFYDLSSSVARDADLVASYGRAGITHYINNVVCQALTASGLSFFNPNSSDGSNPDLEAVFGPAGTELYAGGDRAMSSTADYTTFYDTDTGEEVAKFGKNMSKIGKSGERQIYLDTSGVRLYAGNGHLMTSWTGTNAGNAAINFYDCSNTTANNSDLIASYGRAGITHYINNVVCQALTASGLSFFNPDANNHYLEAVTRTTTIWRQCSDRQASTCTRRECLRLHWQAARSLSTIQTASQSLLSSAGHLLRSARMGRRIRQSTPEAWKSLEETARNSSRTSDTVRATRRAGQRSSRILRSVFATPGQSATTPRRSARTTSPRVTAHTQKVFPTRQPATTATQRAAA